MTTRKPRKPRKPRDLYTRLGLTPPDWYAAVNRPDLRPKSTCRCNASTGICGCITYGTGKLDDNGYWKVPCPHGKEVHTCWEGTL